MDGTSEKEETRRDETRQCSSRLSLGNWRYDWRGRWPPRPPQQRRAPPTSRLLQLYISFYCCQCVSHFQSTDDTICIAFYFMLHHSQNGRLKLIGSQLDLDTTNQNSGTLTCSSFSYPTKTLYWHS